MDAVAPSAREASELALAPARLRILIAEDDNTSRRVLERMLQVMNCDVDVAADGMEALDLFDAGSTDCVFLDVWMPKLDGREVCRVIKERSGERFVPVIFVTQFSSPDDLAACVDAGGDDFISKPVDRTILNAKLRAMQRIRGIHERLREKREAIARQQAELLRDQEVARETFARVLQPCRLENPNLRFLIHPADGFSGDLVLADWTPSGTQLVLFGDFAGRGLRAALGAVPTAKLFHRMCRLGFPETRLLRELNRMLREMLPPGLFLAASLIAIDPQAGRISVWNGGLPAAYLLREGTGVVSAFESMHLPLGILDDGQFDPTLAHGDVQVGDRLFTCSDGLVERLSPAGEMFGAERLLDLMRAPGPLPGVFDRVRAAVETHAGGEAGHDDSMLAELICETRPAPPLLPLSVLTLPDNGEPWRCALTFEGSALRYFDPMPALARMLIDVGGLDGHREMILTVLTELFTNALDHGLLRLDSSLKHDVAGFATYYNRRQSALQGLTEGRIGVVLEHQPVQAGHRVVISVMDSGQGFDPTVVAGGSSERALHGRGLPLVRSLCREVQVLGAGNEVRAVYEWLSAETGERLA